MDGRTSRLLSLLLLGVAAACSNPTEETVSGSRSKVTSRPFDKNAVLDDTSLRDADAMTAADVQKLLDKTPWGTKSVLATYEEGGVSAAQIMVAAAKKHGINPLELVVRVQMEQGLVSKKTAPESTIAIAFGCGCPHSSVCSDKYRGFANQAECAAGTLSRSMDRAVTSQGTVSGWKRNATKKSEDGLEITPKNAATAALYTYTPWVGEAGGGKQGVGGASLHHQVWVRFAEAVSYGEWAVQNEEPSGGGSGEEPSPGEEPNPNGEEPSGEADAGTGTGTGTGADSGTGTGTGADSGTGSRADAGADGGAGEDGLPSGTQGPPEDGSEDDDVIGTGSTPPSSNAPPPSTKGKTPSKPEELPEASEEELAAKKKDSAGCSTTGNPGNTSNALVVVAAAVAMLGARRKR